MSLCYPDRRKDHDGWAIRRENEEKLKKTAKDFYSMTVTVPAKYGREEEMELFTQALKDTFLSSSSAAKRAWREEETRRKNKM